MNPRVCLAGMMLGCAAFAADSGTEMLQRAVTQERAGKINEAIAGYEKIAHDFPKDRQVAAAALIKAAALYEKQGQQKATELYKQVVRDYADQREASTARDRLAALRQPPAPKLTYTRIEFGSGIQNVVATDGQNAVYWDDAKTTLYYGDIGGKNRRVAYQVKAGPTPEVYPSRDLSMALLYRTGTTANKAGWAVIKTDNTGFRELETLTFNPYLLISPPSWSWDNKFVLIAKSEGMLKVTVGDGQVQDLSKAGITATLARFSPDGRFVAFMGSFAPMGGALQATPAEGQRGRQDASAGQALAPRSGIHVMPAEGGEPSFVLRGYILFDWSRDGKNLLLAAPNASRNGLHVVPMENGHASGQPFDVHFNLTDGPSMTTPGGALIVRVGDRPTANAFQAELDGNDQIEKWENLNLVSDVDARYPSFSPDGRQIVYVTGNPSSPSNAVRLYTLADGQDREVYRHAASLLNCLFASAKRMLWCSSPGPDGASIISVNPDSNQGEKVRLFANTFRDPHAVSPDGRFMNMADFRPGSPARHMRWEVGSDSETVLPGFPSPDGRWVLRFIQPEGKGREIQIRRTDGDEDVWKTAATLLVPSFALGPVPVRFTHNGEWLIYANADPQGKFGLYRVATSGGEPQRLGDFPTSTSESFLAVSPDGRQFILQGPPKHASTPEFYQVENFLPKQKSTK